MSIYTKTGDDGQSSLFGGERLSKAKPEFEILGTIDELNASLGRVRSSKIKNLSPLVVEIQNSLFELGTLIANKKTKQSDYARFGNRVEAVEKEINTLENVLPELTNFILPGGTGTAADLHLSRAICRRLERLLVKHNNKKITGFESVLEYINRLSDFLFVLARYANFKVGVKDIKWTQNG